MHFPLLAMRQLHITERPWMLLLDPGPPHVNRGEHHCWVSLKLSRHQYLCLLKKKKEIREKNYSFLPLVDIISAVFCLRNRMPSVGWVEVGGVLRVRGWLGVSRAGFMGT